MLKTTHDSANQNLCSVKYGALWASGWSGTLSSFRVQKAFSINFRENKRLSAEVRVIENEHIRNIRLVKQEIKDTRLWLDKIRESTGESSDGLRPSSADKAKKAKKKRRIPVRSKTVEPVKIKVFRVLFIYSFI